MDNDGTLNQWHPGFSGAVELELNTDKERIMTEAEHLVNSKPIQIDMLIIKKKRDSEIKSEIGKIFRGVNLIEYKSPKDELNLDTFVKSIGYACLKTRFFSCTDNCNRQTEPERTCVACFIE